MSALRFDGSSYLDYGTDLSAVNNLTNWSFSLWVRPETGIANSDRAFDGVSAGGSGVRAFWGTGNVFKYTVRDDAVGVDSNTVSVPLDTWTHIVGAYDGAANLEIYADTVAGTPAASGGSNNDTSSGADFNIGSTGTTGAAQWVGGLAGLIMWNVTLKQRDVDALYAGRIARPESIIFRPRFDQYGYDPVGGFGPTMTGSVVRAVPPPQLLPRNNVVAIGPVPPALAAGWSEVTVVTPNLGTNSLLSLATDFTPVAGDVIQWDDLDDVVTVDSSGVVTATSLPQTFDFLIWDRSANETSNTATVTVTEAGVAAAATTSNYSAVAQIMRRMRRNRRRG